MVGIDLRKYSRSALPFFLLAAIGCNGKSQPANAVAQSAGPPDAKPAGSRPDLPDDSLSVEDYTRLGMPSPDRAWSGVDLIDAAKCLGNLTANGYERIPRYDSVQSGVIFARIASAENLSFFNGKSMPVEVRMPLCNAYIQGLNEVSKIYGVAFMKYGNLSNEMMALVGASLRMAVLMSEVTDEFVAKLDKNDPTYSTRMAGRDRMKNGMANMVFGAIQSITELPADALGARDRLVGVMIETFPALVPRLPEGSRRDAVRKLEVLAKTSTYPDLHEKLDELVTTVRAAIAPSGQRQ